MALGFSSAGGDRLAVLASCGAAGAVAQHRRHDLWLFFANSFGAIATAYGLDGQLAQYHYDPLYAQIQGDVLHNHNLGYALAIGMILITALSNGGYIWLSARSERMRR